MRATALVLAALLVSGCFTSRSSKISLGIGAALLVGGVVAAATDPDQGKESDQHAINGHEEAAIYLISSGLLFAIGGLIGIGIHGRATAAKPSPVTARSDR